MKKTAIYILWSMVLPYFFYSCHDVTFIVPPRSTVIDWIVNDALYKQLLDETIKAESLEPTDSTFVIDPVGEKAFLKIQYGYGCVNHTVEIVIPSEAILNQDPTLPWVINHEREASNNCVVDVIARYTFDLKSIPIENNWRENQPIIQNTGKEGNPVLPILLEPEPVPEPDPVVPTTPAAG